MKMKHFIVYLAAALVVSVMSVGYQAAHAVPFAVADVQADTDACVVTFGGVTSEVIVTVDPARGTPVSGNRICLIDVASAPVGPNTLTIAAKNVLWGGTSNTAPFFFTRPGSPTLPSSIRLTR